MAINTITLKLISLTHQQKICIICPKHGKFWITPYNFLNGHKCAACSGLQRITKDIFISRSNEIHQNKYDYSKIEFKEINKNVCIICPIHGAFWQKPMYHYRGYGCPTCGGNLRLTNEVFIKKAKAIHGNEYDYSKVECKGNKTKVCIICPKHGEWWVSPNNHLRGSRCPGCFGTPKHTKDEFVEKANLIHNKKYDYSKVNYINTATKVCITCPEHGDFWQTPNNHLFGAGCPACPQSNMEGEIRHFLEKNEIKFEQEKTFDWLVFKKKMFLDFFLPEYGVAIEYQGGQHFSPTDLFGGEDFFQLALERDKEKKILCENHGITILYYSNAHIDYPYPVFESLGLLLKAIKQHGKIDSLHWKDQLELDLR